MSASLIDLVFQSLHSCHSPVLWHSDCAVFPEEFVGLLANRVLVPTMDARTVPAARKPGVGVDLKVRALSDGQIFGVGLDDESPTEIALTAEEIRRYAVNVPAVADKLRAASRLRGGVAQQFDDGLLQLGEPPDPVGATRVYLAAPVADGEDLLARCRRLHVLYPKRRVTVFIFCPVSLGVNLQEELGGRLDFQVLVLRDSEDRPCWSPIWPGEDQASEPLAGADYVFRPAGKGWEIAFAGRSVPVPQNLKGLRYIHFLLSHPGEPFSVEELLAETFPHPDQVSQNGKVFALPSARDDDGPSAADLATVTARLKATIKGLKSAPAKQRRGLVAERDKLRAYLRENKRPGRKSDRAGESKRVSVCQAIARATKNFSKPMQAYFAKPCLSIGYKLSYLRVPGIDWVTK